MTQSKHTDMTGQTDHLDALRLRLSHERVRLSNARTPREKAIRTVWVAGIEREIENELRFLGMHPDDGPVITDDELLAALNT